MARPSRPQPSHQGRNRQPRAHCAGLSAFRHMRGLRAPTSGDSALSGLEARPGRRGSGAGRARHSAGRSDRRPWRGTPPRRIPRAARHPRRARGGICRAQGPSRGGDRPLSDPGAGTRRRDRDRLGRRRGARGRGQAARYPGDGDRCGPRRRCAGIGTADDRAHGQCWRKSPNAGASHGSRAMARSSRSGRPRR